MFSIRSLVNYLYKFFVFLLIILNSLANKEINDCHEDSSSNQNCLMRQTKFILYDVNVGEGFNLRRDVYMRMASLVKSLGNQYTLVLPLWDNIPHWKRKNRKKHLDNENSAERWSAYFDLNSLNKFIRVIEFDDFLHLHSSVDDVISLKHFPDAFDDANINNWHEHFELENCTKANHFQMFDDGEVINLLGVEELNYDNLQCVYIEGFVSTLKNVIEAHFANSNAILISNAQVVLHSNYGDNEYWAARTSMRFNLKLVKLANQFRNDYLNSNDENDRTLLGDDWTTTVRKYHGDALGGNYLSVHLRQGDFAKSRPNDTPTIKCAIQQIKFIMNKLSLTDVFIASDTDANGLVQLENGLNSANIKLHRYKNNSLSDGQLAIVDQIIASHAMFFIGTYDSTFSFRIQEEREILGFMPNTTFNAFCGKCNSEMNKICKQESQWMIVY